MLEHFTPENVQALGASLATLALLVLVLGTLGLQGYHVIAEARHRADGSLWEAARYLWSEGQRLKARLDASGQGRGDFAGQLRALAYGAAAEYGIPADAVDLILSRARVLHKLGKGSPGSVLTLADSGEPAFPEPAPDGPPGASQG